MKSAHAKETHSELDQAHQATRGARRSHCDDTCAQLRLRSDSDVLRHSLNDTPLRNRSRNAEQDDCQVGGRSHLTIEPYRSRPLRQARHSPGTLPEAVRRAT